jgi:2-polyprenyl-3-methyl-5-hydroxy-6-metoxy-1,4-benzoquinol methylase
LHCSLEHFHSHCIIFSFCLSASTSLVYRFTAMNIATPVPSVLRKFYLSNKSIVITGAGRGLGLSFARALAELGANIIAIDIHDAPDEEFGRLESYGVKAGYYK